jgi:hypothetical protein
MFALQRFKFSVTNEANQACEIHQDQQSPGPSIQHWSSSTLQSWEKDLALCSFVTLIIQRRTGGEVMKKKPKDSLALEHLVCPKMTVHHSQEQQLGAPRVLFVRLNFKQESCLRKSKN